MSKINEIEGTWVYTRLPLETAGFSFGYAAGEHCAVSLQGMESP